MPSLAFVGLYELGLGGSNREPTMVYEGYTRVILELYGNNGK